MKKFTRKVINRLKKIFRRIFSYETINAQKVLNIFFCKFKFYNKIWFQKRALKDEKSMLKLNYMNKLQDKLSKDYSNKNFVMQDIISKGFTNLEYFFIDSTHNYLNILLNVDEWHYNKHMLRKYPDDTVFCWEIRPSEENCELAGYAIENNKKLVFVGDSFLRSINTMADCNADFRYRKGISFTFDDLTSYFDATRPSRLEQMLNDKNLIINNEQRKRARCCIEKIISNHLTKYNHQPVFIPSIGRKNAEKILVVDQTYGDMSILKGCADEKTFDIMLNKAINENPDADIIVKTHPDTIAGSGGYYTGLKQKDNIYPITYPINPISLIQYCSKVYVCTTQFGFEALMCNKEVHTFGMPFYAGWGLTVDEQTCIRRNNLRTLEEIFYIAYIMYSYYVNPETQRQCEIEDAIDYLIKLRDEYERNRKK